MNKLFKFALAALPMLMLASCAKDDLESEVPKAEKSETRYLQVTLSTSGAAPVSRANTQGDGSEQNPGVPVVGDDGYYDDGTPAENMINTLEFYFYDRSKQYHSYVSMTVDDMPTPPTTNPRPGEKPNINGYYHCNVPVELVQGQTLPTYVLCIVNSVEGTQYQGRTMDDAQKAILGSIYGSEKQGTTQFFGMSNSVYYGDDPVTGEQGVLIMAAPFTTDKLLTDSELTTLLGQASNTELSEEKRNEIEDYTIHIAVERYAVKVNLDLKSLNEETMPPYTVYDVDTTTETVEGVETQATTENPLTLTFTPMRWGVNATEKTFYFLKSFRTSAGVTGENPTGVGNRFATLTELNNIPLFPGWNRPEHKRCFWARTPGYYTDNYPLTSDDVIDNRNDNETPDYDLQYLSWNDCHELGDAYAKEVSDYTMETTMKKTRLTGEGLDDQYLPLASLPSVILLGQYTVEGADPGTDFYLYGKASNGLPKIYSGETTVIPNTKKVKEQMLLDQTIVLKKVTRADGKEVYINVKTTGNTALEGNVSADTYAKFAVMHPDADARNYATTTEAITGGEVRIAADIAVLQLTDVPTEELYYYDPTRPVNPDDPNDTQVGKYVKIEKADLPHVNHLLYQNLGGAHYYKAGMAYFSAPIQHWGWHRSGNPNVGTVTVENPDGTTTTREKTMADWNWGKMETGDFGVVRNHVYTMKIGKIEGLGTGISNEDDPIVPPADKVDYAVHFHVNIQRWAVLPVQNWNW